MESQATPLPLARPVANAGRKWESGKRKTEKKISGVVKANSRVDG